MPGSADALVLLFAGIISSDPAPLSTVMPGSPVPINDHDRASAAIRSTTGTGPEC